MNDKNIDSQSESIQLWRAGEFKATDERALRINRRLSAGVDANIVIFIAIVLGVNGALIIYSSQILCIFVCDAIIVIP